MDENQTTYQLGSITDACHLCDALNAAEDHKARSEKLCGQIARIQELADYAAMWFVTHSLPATLTGKQQLVVNEFIRRTKYLATGPDDASGFIDAVLSPLAEQNPGAGRELLDVLYLGYRMRARIAREIAALQALYDRMSPRQKVRSDAATQVLSLALADEADNLDCMSLARELSDTLPASASIPAEVDAGITFVRQPARSGN